MTPGGRARMYLCTGLALVAAFVLGVATGSNAARADGDDDGAASSQPLAAAYVCPLHPRISEAEPGTCAICGAELEAVDPAASQPTSRPTSQPVSPPGAASGADKLYTCPMHPHILQDEPGACPICGMDLVPKKVEISDGAVAKAGVIRIDPVVVQNMGVRVASVRRAPLARSVRTVGSVTVAEDRLSVVNLRFSGWIEKLRVDETGMRVERGQPLFDIYSPELVSAEQELVVALRTAGAKSPLADSARRRLELFGVPRSERRRVEKDLEPRPRFTVRAPATGYVVHKTVVEGARVMAGSDLYRIADLSTVWIEAEVYEHDAPWISVGAPTRIELSFQGSVQREGQVSYIYPTLNPRTRTLRVRVELPNPNLELRPGAFATVEIDAQRIPDALVVPTEAILHSGQRQIVFVSPETGRYEAREIRTGLVGDAHMTQVTQGLDEGESVVTSGQFLLDSESQLQEAVQKMLAARLQAKAGGTPSASDAHDHGADAALWTCPMHPQIIEDQAGTCPICGMDLVEMKK